MSGKATSSCSAETFFMRGRTSQPIMREADIGGRDQADVAVDDVDDLMRDDGCQFVVVQPVDQPAREDEHRVLAPRCRRRRH